MRHILTPAFAIMAAPALAADDKPFFSLANTDFAVTLGFIVFIGILLYYKVPAMVGGMLDKRADAIRSDLAEARKLRDEAQKLLASYEKKSREVAAQADRIVSQAKEEATRAAALAREEMRATLARRLAAATDQIASAEQAAVREVRDSAVNMAVAMARDILAADMTAARANALIDDAIGVVEVKLH